MANYGPTGGPPPEGSKDPIADLFKKALGPAVSAVDAEAKKLAKSVKRMADDVGKASKRLNAQRSRELTAELNRQEKSKSSLQSQRSRALNKQMNEEEKAVKSLSSQRSREYTKEINNQERTKRNLDKQRMRSYASEIRNQESAKKKLESQRSKSLIRQANDEDKKKADAIKASAKAVSSLSSQRSREYSKDILAQESAKRKLESQRSKAITKQADEVEKKKQKDLAAQNRAVFSLQRQRSKEYTKSLNEAEKQRKKKDKEKADKMQEEEEYRLGGLDRLFGAIDGVVGAFKTFTGLLGQAAKFVAAFNPGLAMQLGFAFKDLYATIGYALQPVVNGMIGAIRTLADFLVPVAKQFAPIFADLTDAFIGLFVNLFPFFRDLLSVVALVVQWFSAFIRAMTILIDPIIMALTGFAVILIVEAIPAVISFATSVLTMSSLMTAGLSIIIGALASLAFWFLRATGIFKGIEFKPGVSAGMGARQASYTGITEFGKNLLQQGLGSSTANATVQTADNTKRCAELLDQIANKKGPNIPVPWLGGGGPGVKVQNVGGKDAARNNPGIVPRWMMPWL